MRPTRPASAGRVPGPRGPAGAERPAEPARPAVPQAAGPQEPARTGRSAVRAALWTAALGLALAVLTTLLATRVHLPAAQGMIWPTLGLLGGAWLVFAGAVWLLRRVPARAAVVLILLGGVAAGLACASAPERSSDDLYRYVWDGKVQAAGIDPYEYVPASPQLAGLRDPALWPDFQTSWCVHPGTANPDGPGDLATGCTLINRPGVHTIYPPVAEAYFLAVHELSPADSRYKPIQLAGVFLSLLTTIALLLGLRALRRDFRMAALWAWCPLIAYETGNGAHIDVLAAFFTVAGLAYLAVASRTGATARKYVIGGVLLGLGVGAKLTPALALPAVLRRRPILVATTVLGTFAAVYVPHVMAVGAKVIGFIPGYVHQQGYSKGNGYMLLSLVLPEAWTGAAAALIMAGTALAVLRYADANRPWRGTLVLTGVTLFVSTPVFAWYPVLLVALVALDGRVEWLALAMAVYINSIMQTLGLSLINAQRVGYGLALLVVLAATALRHVQRRRRVTRELIDDAVLALTTTAGSTLTPTPASSPAATVSSEETAVPLVDVVLPCLDEAGALPYVLGRMPEGYRAIVVDNGSTDGSAELARELGALVVTEKRRGFGAACHAGLAAATAPIVCFCDCDGSFDPRQLPRVAAPVIDGESDLVLGRRRPVTSGAWPLHARIANKFLAFRLRRTGVRVKDLGPMRAARREALLELGVADRRSGYPLETVLAAARSGWQITETNVDYAPRTGKSKVTGTLTGTLQAIRDMNRVWKEATR